MSRNIDVKGRFSTPCVSEPLPFPKTSARTDKTQQNNQARSSKDRTRESANRFGLWNFPARLRYRYTDQEKYLRKELRAYFISRFSNRVYFANQ